MGLLFHSSKRVIESVFVVETQIANSQFWQAELFGLLDDSQTQFLVVMSTVDIVQMVVRVEEVVEDCKRRVNNLNECDWLMQD